MYNLAPETTLYEAVDGYVLSTADHEYFAIALPDKDIDDLLRVLGSGARPASSDVVTVLDALRSGGHVTGPAPVSAQHHGRIETAVATLLADHPDPRMRTARVAVSDEHLTDTSLDTAALDTSALDTSADLVSYRDGITQIIVPSGVPAADVVRRRRAATVHRTRVESRYLPVPEGRRIESTIHPVTDRAAAAVAATIVAELERRAEPVSRESEYTATAIDLRSLTVTRHLVLPVPAAPR